MWIWWFIFCIDMRMIFTSLSKSSLKNLSPRIQSLSSLNQKATNKFRSYFVSSTIDNSEKYFKKAQKHMKINVAIDKSISNVKNAHRKHSAQSMDFLMQSLTKPITEVLNKYKNFMRLVHPYEATVAELTIVARAKTGHPKLEEVLNDLKRLRAETSTIGKLYASRAKNATSAAEAKELLATGQQELETLYSESSLCKALDELVEIQKEFKKIPVIELTTPTVVLVGAPNVGKSSIVRVVSSGTPEVNDYPFTTRGVTIGHIVNEEEGTRYQVMDTPGLLDRPEDERNEMEKLTYASLAHLPTAVIFVIDPTGTSGEKSTLQAQLNVRSVLKSRFPRRPWLDIVSKGDIPLSEEIKKTLPVNYLAVSVKSGQNIEVLKDQINTLLRDLSTLLINMRESSE